MLNLKIILCTLGMGAVLFLENCSKPVGNTLKRVKEGNMVELGMVIPEIRAKHNDTLNLALYPHARVFFMDMRLKNSEGFIELIKKANKADLPVRVKVYESNQLEVAEITPATREDIKIYRKQQQPG